MKVKELMCNQVRAVPESATLAEAASLMWEQDCGAVPVIEQRTGRLRGIVTDRDICMGGLTQGRSLDQIPVGDCMSRRLWSCKADNDLEVAQETMREHHVRRLPVVDEDEHLVGILSLMDLAVGARERKDIELEQGVARTLAGICDGPAAQARPTSRTRTGSEAKGHAEPRPKAKPKAKPKARKGRAQA